MSPRLVIDPVTGDEREAFATTQYDLNTTWAAADLDRFHGPLVKCWRCRNNWGDVGVCPVCGGTGTVECPYPEHDHG